MHTYTKKELEDSKISMVLLGLFYLPKLHSAICNLREIFMQL